MPAVSVTRTPRGWSVITPAGEEHAQDLVEGLSLADLVAEQFGVPLEPDRTARRSARGSAAAASAECDGDPRVAALERTVAQLEHALAARVSTERAIGVLAERHGTSARIAFESLRREARSQCRPVHELARAVLDGLCGEDVDGGEAVGLHVAPRPATQPAAQPSADRPGVVAPLVSPPGAPEATGEAVADGRP